MKMRGTEDKVFKIVNNPDEALEAIKEFDKELSGFDHTKHCEVCEDKAFMT